MKKLFEEVYLKNLKIKNRICIPPMVVSSTDSGYVTTENIKHYTKLAKGGAGIIIQEATCINIGGRLSKGQLGIWEDEQIEGLRKIVEAVHSEKCRILIQIHHAGVSGISEPRLCPSPYQFNNFGKRVIGTEMTKEDIKSVQNDFIDASGRAYEAGYDGIELHGCHSYIISQFLNRNINKRTDEYGTNPERFVLEIVSGIRKVTPKEFIVGIRLGGYEPRLEDGIRHAEIFEKNGIDFLDISYGFFSEQEVNVSENYRFSEAVFAAEKIKERVSIPVFGVHKINSPEIAEEILNKTSIDIVDIGRCFLVNSNWANDAREGKYPGKCLECKRCIIHEKGKDACLGKIMFHKKGI